MAVEGISKIKTEHKKLTNPKKKKKEKDLSKWKASQRPTGQIKYKSIYVMGIPEKENRKGKGKKIWWYNGQKLPKFEEKHYNTANPINSMNLK